MTGSAVRVVDFQAAPLSTLQRRLDVDRTIDSDPVHDIGHYFENQTGALTAGVWQSTPGKWQAFVDRDEFCYIIEGHVILTNDEGHAQTFKTGDAFLIPNGFRGTWEVVETTRKHYVILNYPAAEAAA